MLRVRARLFNWLEFGGWGLLVGRHSLPFICPGVLKKPQAVDLVGSISLAYDVQVVKSSQGREHPKMDKY